MADPTDQSVWMAKARFMLEAYEAGRESAARIQPGDKFLGAFGAAAETGFELERSMFAVGFLEVLERRFPRGVVTDQSGAVVPQHINILT